MESKHSNRPQGKPESEGASEFLTFTLGAEEYGIDILKVQEIRGYDAVTTIVNSPPFIKGVVNLRGVIVPIIDLRCRFGQGLTEATPIHVVIIVQVGPRMVGLLADRVLDIVSFEAHQVQPVPKIAQASRIDFLCGLVTVENSLIALIDLPNLLSLPASEVERTQAN